MRVALVTAERPLERDTDFDYLAPALRRRGAVVEAPAWSDSAVDWAAYDVAVISSTWDYHEREQEFRRWLEAVEALTTVRNRFKTTRWNLDKRYLRELEGAGVPTIPTVWSGPGDLAATVATIAEREWDDVIVKPVVDLGARRLARVSSGGVETALEQLAEPAMAQPFLPSLEREGELSVVFIAGRPAHALRKLPAPGDFRVQPAYGGVHEAVAAPARAVEIGQAALARAPGRPLYARADLVSGAEGELLLIELELIEPCLYLDIAPASAELLAREILAAATG